MDLIRPNRRFWICRLTEIAVIAAPVTLLTVWGSWTGGGFAAALFSFVVMALLTGVIVAAIWGSYRSLGYREEEGHLSIRSGIFVRHVSSIPFGAMQVIDVSAGPFERMFDLATLRLRVGVTARDARIPGLGRDDAKRLRDLLTGSAQPIDSELDADLSAT